MKKTLIELMATPFHSIAHGFEVLTGGSSDPFGNAKKRNLKKLISTPYQSIAYVFEVMAGVFCDVLGLSLIHISEPTRLRRISYAVFCLKKKIL